MPALCQASEWIHDDTDYVLLAIAEYNLRMPAYTKPVKAFGELPISGQSWVLQKAAELKLDSAG
jgi:hypothetical protein